MLQYIYTYIYIYKRPNIYIYIFIGHNDITLLYIHICISNHTTIQYRPYRGFHGGPGAARPESLGGQQGAAHAAGGRGRVQGIPRMLLVIEWIYIYIPSGKLT